MQEILKSERYLLNDLLIRLARFCYAKFIRCRGRAIHLPRWGRTWFKPAHSVYTILVGINQKIYFSNVLKKSHRINLNPTKGHVRNDMQQNICR